VTAKPAFLFDLDGTLADTLPDLAASTNHVRAMHGLAAVADATVRSYIGDGAKALVQRALAELAPNPATIETAFASYLEHHVDQCTMHARLFDGVAAYLQQLRQLGHAIAVVTNKPERFAVPVARHLGLMEFTNVIVGGDTLPTKKPDPAMLRHALEQLATPATGATMVGDGLQDLRPAKHLGLRTIACLFGYGDPAALRQEGADIFWTAFAKPEAP
jgi:phosphoglycolate phosphatase